ncbi:MAG: hypothetical protein IT269_08620 [Saprospiraceae bacterium]|nr:hypothetical protein [Saprospiraceae bacterium]
MQKLLILIALLLPRLADAQPKAQWYDHPGSITLEDGTVKKGVIRNFGSDDEPWHYQSSVRFMDSTTWNGLTKARNKDFEKYEPDEIKAYELLDNGLVYVSKPYSDMTSVSIKMAKTWYFMRAIVQGKTALYHYYDAPPNFYIGKEGEYEKMKQEKAINNYVLVEQQENKLKNITDIDLRKSIEDCPAVLAKYDAGEYGTSPMDTGKKKGLGKFIAKVVDSNKMKEFAAPLFRDYNKCF